VRLKMTFGIAHHTSAMRRVDEFRLFRNPVVVGGGRDLPRARGVSISFVELFRVLSLRCGRTPR
jgi:hypothetical protein